MLFPQLSIILASQSPRRKILLQQAGFVFETIIQDVPEIIPPNMPPKQVPSYLAKLKADAIKPILSHNKQVIIAADTIVCLDEQIFGKPQSEAHAIQTLLQLSGKKHQVITGVCLTSQQKQHCFSQTSQVYFNKLTQAQIEYYIQNYKPYDKAGAYAIQEWIGLIGIRKIKGCYFNIMGLPVAKLLKELNIFC